MIIKKLPQKSNEKKINNKKQKRYNALEKATHAIFMLKREESRVNMANLSAYAEREDISRTTLYKIKEEIENKYSQKKPGPKAKEASKVKPKELKTVESVPKFDIKLGNLKSKLSEIEQNCLVRTILQLAITPASTKEIRDVVKEAFKVKMSKSKIKNILNAYAKKGYDILQRIGMEKKVNFLAIDEIFSGSRPILTGVELNSFAVVICESAFNRNSETWERVLNRFDNLELVVSDQASGIIKAVAKFDKVRHQWDIFHFKRDVSKLLRHIESQAYKKIEKEYKAEKKVNTGQSNLEKDYEKIKKEALKAITLFDEVNKTIKIIYKALDVFDNQGNFTNPRKSLKKIDKTCDRLEKVSKNKKILNIAKRARNPHLLSYLIELQDCLLSMSVSWKQGIKPIARPTVIKTLAKHWYYSNEKKIHLSFQEGESKTQWKKRRESIEKKRCYRHLSNLFEIRYLQSGMKNFDDAFNKITTALNELFRASSLVESWNSQVRIAQQVKKGLHHNFLALSVLHWNMTPFQDGKRKDKSPFQILGISTGESDWLDLLLTPEEKNQSSLSIDLSQCNLQRA